MTAVMCALILSITRRPFFISKNPSGRCEKHLSSRSPIISASIQPFTLHWMTAPDGKGSLGIVFLLNMIMGGGLVPSAQQARTTVKWDFSWLVVVTVMVVLPLSATLLPIGTSNVRGTSSIFTMWLGPTSCSRICSLTNFWKLSIFCWKLSGSFWQSVVRAVITNRWHLIKRKHQDGPPIKSTKLVSFGTVWAFRRTCTVDSPLLAVQELMFAGDSLAGTSYPFCRS